MLSVHGGDNSIIIAIFYASIDIDHLFCPSPWWENQLCLPLWCQCVCPPPPAFFSQSVDHFMWEKVCIFVNTEKANPLLCLLCLCASKKHGGNSRKGILSIPAGGTTDLPLGSTVNDLFLSTNELNTEQGDTHVWIQEGKSLLEANRCTTACGYSCNVTLVMII